MKRIISALTAVIMIFSICAINVFAEGVKPTFSVNAVTGDRGDAVEVTLSVENVSASALTVQVKFDTNVLEATGGTLLQQVGMMKQINAADNANSRGLYDYSMFDMSDATFADGALATLKFKVKDTAAYGDTALEVVVTAMQTAGEEVADYVLNNGKVAVKCLNHDTTGVEWDVTSPAKCEETGTRVKYCTKCGSVAETDTISALGHKYLNKYDAVCANGCGTERDESYKPVFSITSDGGVRGETVEVLLNVSNVLANALTVDVSFDKDVLEATGGEILQNLGMMKQLNSADNANERGVYSYNAFDVNDMAFEDGALAKFTFKIKDAAAYGKTSISVSGVTFGYAGGEVPFENCKTESGEICVHNIEGVEWTVVVPATCEGEGLQEKYCSVCGGLVESEVINAIGHDWDEGVITTPATCEEKGVKTFTCQHDETHTYTEDVDALGHDWDEGVITTPATCEEKGVKTFTCQHDETHTYTEDVDALGHDYEGVDWIVTLNPTWETEGSKYRVCTRDDCGHEDVVVIPAATVESVVVTKAPNVTTYKVHSNGTAEFDPTGMELTVNYSDWDVPTVITEFDGLPLVDVTTINPEYEYIFTFAGEEVKVLLNIEGKLGDIDNNGTVNIIDVQKLFVAVGNGLAGEIATAIGDFDGNGTVNIIDVQKLFVAVGNGLIS